MTFPAPAAWLRHRGPALVLASIDAWDGRTVLCGGAPGTWSWARLLEGAAQSAGIACALADPSWRRGAVVAEYRDVDVRVERHAGAVRFEASMLRPLLAYRRCRATATTPDGAPLLAAVVTLLPDQRPA